MSIRVEVIRAVIAGFAIVGAIGLGFRNPEQMGSAAIGAVSTAIGGYFGLQEHNRGDRE